MKEMTAVGSLLEKAEAYGETSVELIKLKAIEKSVRTASGLTLRIVCCIFLFLVVLMLNIAAALALGEHYNSAATGFLLVAAADAVLLVLIYLLRKNTWVENKMSNVFLKMIFSNKEESEE